MPRQKKKRITISLDKLDNEYLEALRARTGKTTQDIIKLALTQLHDKLCGTQDSVVIKFTESCSFKQESQPIRIEPSWPSPQITPTVPAPSIPPWDPGSGVPSIVCEKDVKYLAYQKTTGTLKK